jgi:hypothetical protein
VVALAIPAAEAALWLRPDPLPDAVGDVAAGQIRREGAG